MVRNRRSGVAYSLHDGDGNRLAEVELPARTLRPGDEIATEDGARYRIVGVVYVRGEAGAHRGFAEAEPLPAPADLARDA